MSGTGLPDEEDEPSVVELSPTSPLKENKFSTIANSNHHESYHLVTQESELSRKVAQQHMVARVNQIIKENTQATAL